MRVRFLGTGTSQGIPVIACPCRVCSSADARDKRLRSSIFIENEGVNVVIDTGPDFRQQMLCAKIQRLDAVLLTHGHKDHIGGLDDVRAFNYLQRKPMNVYAQASVLEDIRREFSYAFGTNRYPGVPELNLVEIGIDPFYIADKKFIPIQVMHHEMPVLAFRIDAFTYITDASDIPEAELNKVIGSEVVVINALRKQKHHSHFTLDEALEIIQKIQAREAFLTHISHQMGRYIDINPSLPEHVSMAYDGLTLDL